jgi:hypothetical protein
MTIEDTLRQGLSETLDTLEVPPGDPGRAFREGDRGRGRRRTWRVGVAVAAGAALACAGVVVGLGWDGGDQVDPAPAGGWTRLPDPPISPRTGGIAGWTGSEAIFLGGEIDNLCHPNASCTRPSVYGRDGAAYDPASDSWRRIARAPVPVGNYTPRAMVGDNLVIVADNRTWHAYDASEDRWRQLPTPPQQPSWDLGGITLSVLDGRVYAIGRTAVQVLDLAKETWSALPVSPIQPKLDRHYVAATPEGVVVVGLDSTQPNDGTKPSYLMAEVWDSGRWHRLERSDMMGGFGGWHWTGERLVSPDIQCVDGGETNGYGRCIPNGGTLDPGTGTWGPLPNSPDPEVVGGGWGLDAAEGSRILTWGYLYDDRTGRWTKLPSPAGAPQGGTAAVWADGTLIAFGGVDWETREPRLSNLAWTWTP